MKFFKEMSSTQKAGLELIRIGLAMIGIFLLINNGGKALEAYSSQSWPTTTGEITRSAVEIRSDALRNRKYYSSIKYKYLEDVSSEDVFLIGNRVGIDPIPPADNRALAEDKLQAYPKDTSVTVYYNLKRPEKSFLDPEFSLKYLVMPVIGLLCLSIACFLWIADRLTV